MADEVEQTDTPIGDQLAAEQETKTDPIEPEAPGATGSDDVPRLGFHDGRWHSTFTVAGELSQKQIEDCAHETLLQAQNNGYVADGNHLDIEAHTITGEDGKPTQVVVTVAVRENRIVPRDETDSESSED